MRQLPYHDIPLALGINTNFEAATQGRKTLRSAVNVDTYRKWRALAKVPGSSKITAAALGAPSSVRSIHQYEFTSLAGVRTRKQLATANTTLYDITGGGSTVVWTTPDLYDEALLSVVADNKIFLSSENQRGLVTGGVKYDGRSTAYSTTNLGSRWGVVAPGAEPTVRHALDDHTLWTATGTASKSNSTTSRDGTGSVQVDSSGAGTAGIEDAGLALNFGTAVRAFVWLFVPAGGLQKLATSGTAVDVELGNAGLGNSDHFTFSVGDLVVGWNLLSLDLTAANSQDGTGANYAAIDTIRLAIVTTAAQSGFLWDNFYTVDNGQVTGTASGTDGPLVGTFTYRATYVTEFGLESNAGPVPTEEAAYATNGLEFINPVAGEQVVIGDTVYTFRSSGDIASAAAYSINLGASSGDAAANLVKAINGTGVAGTDYSTGTAAHPDVEAEVTATADPGDATSPGLVITAREIGAAANAIICETRSSGTLVWNSITMTGGSDGIDSVTTVAARASGTLSIATNPTNGDTVTIGTTVYTFRNALTPTAYEVLIGGSAGASRANLRYAINDNGEGTGVEGTEWANGTNAHPSVTAEAGAGTTIVVRARQRGAEANTIGTTDALTAGADGFASTTLTGGRDGENVSLSTVPVSSDPQTVARRIYRDFNGDRVYRFVLQIDNNVDTTATDDVADSALGEATMPIAGDDEIDHSPPERMRDVALFNNRVFGISGDDPRIVLVSDVDLYEAFPIVNQLSVEEELVALRSHAQGLLLYGRGRTFILRGDGTASDPFVVEVFNSELGANNPRSIVDALGFNVSLNHWEMFLVDNPGTVNPTRGAWLINGPILNQFSGAAAADLSAAFMVHDSSRYRILTFVGSSIYSYQYGTLGFQEITGDGPGVDPKDLRMTAWWTLSLPVTVTCAADVEETADRAELWIGCSDGHVYQLQDTATTAYANGAASAAVAASLETHAVPIGPQADRGKVGNEDMVTGRGEPRYVEINSESTNGITWSCTVTVLSEADGVSLGSTTFDITCPAGTSVVCVPVPMIGVIGSWCRVSLSNSTTTDGIIRNLRLYYIGRASRRGPRST